MSHLPKPKRFSRRRFLQAATAGVAGAALAGVSTATATRRWYDGLLNAPALPLSGLQMPAVTTMTDNGIRLHNIQTGYVAVKRAHREYSGPDGTGILAIAADRQWTEWLPIHTWVIEHPEGVIVIDSGETARALEPDYYQGGDSFFYGSFLRMAVTPADEIGPQLEALGIPPRDVRWVIQTHLHGDHVGGIGYFPNAEFFLGAPDYPTSLGALPYHYPTWLEPTLVTFADDDVAGFGQTYSVTQAGDVLIVPTPGHSPGHQSVLLRGSEVDYLFAGDASFDVPQLRGQRIAGIVAEPAGARSTLTHIQTYLSERPTVYLPSHDADARRRFLAGEPTLI